LREAFLDLGTIKAYLPPTSPPSVYGLDYGQSLFHRLSHGPLRAIEDIPYAFPRSATTACRPWAPSARLLAIADPGPSGRLGPCSRLGGATPRLRLMQPH